MQRQTKQFSAPGPFVGKSGGGAGGAGRLKVAGWDGNFSDTDSFMQGPILLWADDPENPTPQSYAGLIGRCAPDDIWLIYGMDRGSNLGTLVFEVRDDGGASPQGFRWVSANNSHSYYSPMAEWIDGEGYWFYQIPNALTLGTDAQGKLVAKSAADLVAELDGNFLLNQAEAESDPVWQDSAYLSGKVAIKDDIGGGYYHLLSVTGEALVFSSVIPAPSSDVTFDALGIHAGGFNANATDGFTWTAIVAPGAAREIILGPRDSEIPALTLQTTSPLRSITVHPDFIGTDGWIDPDTGTVGDPSVRTIPVYANLDLKGSTRLSSLPAADFLGTDAEGDLVAVSAPASDGKAKVSAVDTASGFLIDKMEAGSNVTLSKSNPAGNEKVRIDVSLQISSPFGQELFPFTSTEVTSAITRTGSPASDASGTRAFAFVPLGTVTVAKMRVAIGNTGGSNMRLGIYDASGNRVAQTNRFAPVSGSILTVSLTASVVLAGGQMYYMAIWSDDTSGNLQTRNIDGRSTDTAAPLLQRCDPNEMPATIASGFAFTSLRPWLMISG